jgi:flagellar FliL protein
MAEKKIDSAGYSSGTILQVVLVVVVLILVTAFLFTRYTKSEAKQAPDLVLFDLGDFTTNLSDTSELKYVKTDVTLELSGKSLQNEVQSEQPLLRDCIINMLNDETSQDIMTNRVQLKNDAMSQINKHLSTGEVTNIYFSDLIMQ